MTVNAKVLIFLLLACLLVMPALASDIGESPAPATQTEPHDFVGIVVSVTPDPLDGQWMQVRVVYYIVRVWYRSEVKMPVMGTKIRILAIYVGEFPYPDRYVSIYQGLSWGAIYE